jgi:hypothetical protein
VGRSRGRATADEAVDGGQDDVRITQPEQVVGAVEQLELGVGDVLGEIAGLARVGANQAGRMQHLGGHGDGR